jgi:hypothetical protein
MGPAPRPALKDGALGAVPIGTAAVYVSEQGCYVA